jgi:Glycosyl hydrolase family 115/Gylcosyl hydrolase family 115 C-terminal domain
MNYTRLLALLVAAPIFLSGPVRAAETRACSEPVSVCDHGGAADFALIRNGQPVPVILDKDADPAVRHVAASFTDDLERVSGRRPNPVADIAAAREGAVVIGVLGHSAVIDALAQSGKITAPELAGQWEAFRQIVVDRPFPNVPRVLAIVGSDRRGAVFGTYDLSRKIGVSPWYWFADVPVRRQAQLFVTAGSRRDQPLVKYRGFFINDEDPAFNSWARHRFGGINSDLYANVFELMLRLKGNLLWPAMWRPKAFFEDDPRNMVLADEMGVVIGTTHHEPMMRAHDEWHRHEEQGVTGGAWDYTTNAANLRTFWRGGLERMMSKDGGQAYDSVVTVGMRGDGDEPMGGADAIGLMQAIVADQRKIIAEVTGKPADQTPQVWALYKEVQDYYDRGMKVPDDVTLLFSDDNWGQIRRLPGVSAPPRRGGSGVYYHFDYVGGPRNYKWLNTNDIGKVWQQMDLAYARGARTLWMVNVGDIKPMEFPLSFWMDQAWSPPAMTLDALQAYPEEWARATFGPSLAAPIGQLIATYGHLAARRKPELLDADSFPLGRSSGATLEGGEFGRIVAQWRELESRALAVKRRVPKEYADAWFELVEHPISAFANLYELYYAVAWNRRLAEAHDSRANVFADQAQTAFRRDQQITAAYHALAGGKWDGMMSEIHIGYTSWNDPPAQKMPEVRRVNDSAPVKPIVFEAGEGAAGTTLEASHFSRAQNGKGLTWRVIPSLQAVTAFPQGRPATAPDDNVRLEYDVSVDEGGDRSLLLYLVPTLDTDGHDGIRIGVSIDDSPVQTLISQLEPTADASKSQAQKDWVRAVIDNVHVLSARLPGVKPGKHTIRIWRLDDNAVLQKLMLDKPAH